jgi:hypothetical protein
VKEGKNPEYVVDKPYKSLVGSLLYPSQWCWPDLSYSVGALSQVIKAMGHGTGCCTVS